MVVITLINAYENRQCGSDIEIFLLDLLMQHAIIILCPDIGSFSTSSSNVGT